MDLALRNGKKGLVPKWLAAHGHRFESEGFLLQTAWCLPAVAKALVGGALREVVALSGAEIAAAVDVLDAAVEQALAADAKPAAASKVIKRRVGCEYSQVHLGPEKLDAKEQKQIHFQKKDDSARGMSLFPTMVGIATPNETDYVDAVIELSKERSAKIDGATQAVTFPITVRGPLLLASATGGEDDAFDLPKGDYDVLARFVPKKAPKASEEAGLRVFALHLTFHPKGALGAPKTLRMESSARAVLASS